MLFGKKKQPLAVSLVTVQQPWIAAGFEVQTNDRSYAEDAAKLQQKFADHSGSLEAAQSPWALVVFTGPKGLDGSFRLFTGQLVAEEAGNAETFTMQPIPAGLYARMTVEYRGAMRWAVDVAKARRYFYKEWLPTSAYHCAGSFQDLEYYDQRSRIDLASIDLYFPLQAKD